MESLWDTPRMAVRRYRSHPADAYYSVVTGPSRTIEGELFTAQQVADLLHVGKSTVGDWRRAGDITAVPLPKGRWRYPSTDPMIAAALAAVRRRR